MQKIIDNHYDNLSKKIDKLVDDKLKCPDIPKGK